MHLAKIIPSLLIHILIFDFGQKHFVNGAVRACFFDSNAVMREGSAKFNFTDHYLPGLCTHLIFEKFGIEGGTFELTGTNTSYRMDALAECKKFRNRQNPPLKILASLGGWRISAYTDGFQQMIGSRENRQKFIKNVLKFVKENDLDGIDIHWQYWVTYGNRVADLRDLLALFREFRQQNIIEKGAANSSAFLLTATITGNAKLLMADPFEFRMDSNILRPLFGADPFVFTSLLDYIWLLTHDFHGNWDHQTAFHASLHNYEDPKKELRRWHLNLEYTVKYWLGGRQFAENENMTTPVDQIANRERIVVGLSMFGRFWLVNEDAEPKVGEWRTGTEEKTSLDIVGVTAYYEVCHQLVHECAERHFDSSQWPFNRSFQPFLVSRPVRKNGLRQWISYEDAESIQAKLDWLESMNVTNVAIRHLDEDDFLGTCYGQKYPLIMTIYDWHQKMAKNADQYLNKTKIIGNKESIISIKSGTAAFNRWKMDNKLIQKLSCIDQSILIFASLILFISFLLFALATRKAYRIYRYRKLDSGDFFGTMPLCTTNDSNESSLEQSNSNWLEWERRNLVQFGKIGQGTFGCCYKMWNKQFDEILVKKVIDTRGTMIGGSDMNELKLHEEIRELKRKCQHKGGQNIIDFYGGYEFAREIVIFTEFMEFSLNRINSPGKALSEDFIGRIMVAVVKAMDFLWNAEPEKRLLHRDIKPANILVSKNGVVKLCDFGVSRILSTQTLANGGKGTLVGSDGFIAPELLEGAPYSVQSDIFSLGQTLLQLATVHLATSKAAQLVKEMLGFAQKNQRNKLEIEIENNQKMVDWERSAEFEDFLLGCLAWECQYRLELNTLMDHPFYCEQNKNWEDPKMHSKFCAWIGAQLRREMRRKWRHRISSTINFYQRFCF